MTVEVHTSEEKGSDVNLAVQLLHDAWSARFDVAVVVSNGSDLEAPIRIVKEEHRKPVGLLCPHDGYSSPQLKSAATFVRHIRDAHLRASQFPSTIVHDSRNIEALRLVTTPAAPTWPAIGSRQIHTGSDAHCGVSVRMGRPWTRSPCTPPPAQARIGDQSCGRRREPPVTPRGLHGLTRRGSRGFA